MKSSEGGEGMAVNEPRSPNVMRRWLRRRLSLADEFWTIRAVQADARLLVEELERRRDGFPPQRLEVRDLRRALEAVSGELDD